MENKFGSAEGAVVWSTAGKSKKSFKTFERVLVRDEDGRWMPDLYSHFEEQTGLHQTLVYGDAVEISDDDIMAFKENPGLAGRREEEAVAPQTPRVEIGDWVVSVNEGWRKFSQYRVFRYTGIAGDSILLSDRYVTKLIIPFNKFNPYNHEQTARNMLTCVDGELVPVERKRP